MGDYSYSVWIDATPGHVWRTYVDPYLIPEWQTGRPVIRDVSGDPGEPRSTYVSQRGPLAARTKVVEATAPARLVTESDAYLGLQLVVTSDLVERAGGTDLLLSVRTRWPPGRRALGRVIDRVVVSPREARKELAALKALVEREPAS